MAIWLRKKIEEFVKEGGYCFHCGRPKYFGHYFCSGECSSQLSAKELVANEFAQACHGISSEDLILESIFSSHGWRDRYSVHWCNLCMTASILCPDCKNTSCNCGGCEKCNKDISEFNALKTRPQEYGDFSYTEGKDLERIIVSSFERNENELNWKNLVAGGHLSTGQIERFSRFIEKSKEKAVK